MAGIYIHIPFCRKACHYCNFHFSTSGKLLPKMVSAICREAELRNDYIEKDISTIYIGGGTPSLLSMEELRSMLRQIFLLFKIDPGAEFTLEANPDDIDTEKLAQWRSLGVNRLSIGVQSFFEEDLKWMNRAHTAKQAHESIVLSRQAGFENISIDLIYGTPQLTNDRWQQNLCTSLELNIPHLSCYALTVEPNTALKKMIDLKKTKNIDPDQQSRQFEILMHYLEQAGYEHYEISNFAKPGFRSRHNSGYWRGKHYLGLGPSAHSFNGKSRQWNISNNAMYIESLGNNIVPFEVEILTDVQKLNEYIMTSLRTSEGLSLEEVNCLSGEKIRSSIVADAQKFIQQDLLEQQNGALVLTQKGKLFADGIAAELFRT